MSPETAPDPAPDVSDGSSRHRSGAVARMLRMPVATLRVWERRYGLTQPALSPSGQRLYDADDVRRLALIKQLTDLGHAIGRLAGLDMAQLLQVAATHAQALASRQAEAPASTRPAGPQPWRVAVIGPALVARLQQPGLLHRLSRAAMLVDTFDGIDAVRACLGGAATEPASVFDAVLIHAPSLQADALASLTEPPPATSAWSSLPKAVLYRYASDAVCTALADAGIALLREPQPDVVLAQWLDGLARASSRHVVLAPPAAGPTEPVPPRRWDDAALADFAGLSSTIACECPRHVAELLVQLSHFEAYSAECAQRSPADAALHTHLRLIAARARASFETGLEAIARHEGLLLPPTTHR